MVRSLSLFVVVLDAELLLHLPVVKDAEDVLARTVDGAAQQEVGEAEVVILLGQQVITVLKQTRPVLKVLYICYSSFKYISISLNCSIKIIKSAPKLNRSTCATSGAG